MNPEDKIKVLAEADGYCFCRSEMSGGVEEWHDEDGEIVFNMKPYLTSYDAIIPLIVKWCKVKNVYGVEVVDEKKMTLFSQYLYSVHESPEGFDLNDCFGENHHCIFFCMYLQSTPSQLSDALIKALGKWKD